MVSISANPPPTIPDHTLYRLIGKGAYGEVWLARNIMGAWRAVKVVYRDWFGTSRPYEREFEGIRKFEPVSHAHESQLDVLHVGRNDSEGYFYYVLELADDRQCGREIEPDTYQPRTLHSDLQEHRRLPAGQCLQVGITLCKALEHLHSHGLIHRDIKPSNIIFLHGRPMLADIGLVARIDETLSFVGTEGFVPPEGPGSVQADIYSLGKVLYELHTGLDRGNFPELPTMLEPNEDALLARELNLVILKACAPEFGKRHADARELREELELLQNGKSIFRLRQAEKRAAVFRRVSLVTAALSVVVLIAYLSALRANRRADANARIAQNELWNARLAEARAGRLAREMGRKRSGLEALQAAAQVRSSVELRNEVVAHLALFDFELPAAKSPVIPFEPFTFDSELRRRATISSNGLLQVRQQADGVLSFSSQTENFKGIHDISFERADEILALNYHSGATALLELATTNLFQIETGERFIGFTADKKCLGVLKNGRFTLRQFQSGRKLAEITSTNIPKAAALHTFRNQVALISDRRVELWDLNPSSLSKVEEVDGAFSSGAFVGDQLVLGYGEGTARVWNLSSGYKRAWQAHNSVVSSITILDEEALIATSSFDGLASYWRIDSGRMEFSSSRDLPISISRDGLRAALLSRPNWSMTKASPRHGYRSLDLTSLTPPTSWLVAFSQGGEWLAACSRQGLAIFHAKDLRRLLWQPGNFVDFCFLDKSNLLTVSRNALERWTLIPSANSLELKKAEPVNVPGLTYFENVSTTKDGRFLAVCAGQDRLAMVDLANGRLTSFENSSVPRSPAITANGEILITGAFHGEGPIVWDARTGKPMRHLERDNSKVYLRPDGKVLLSAGAAQHRFYDTSDWKLLAEISTESGHDLPNCAAWSRDGATLALVKERKYIDLFRGKSLELLVRLTSSDPWFISDVAFSPDGLTLAVGTETGRVEIWKIDEIRSDLRRLKLDWADGE
jgi:WD40 repeat protein